MSERRVRFVAGAAFGVSVLLGAVAAHGQTAPGGDARAAPSGASTPAASPGPEPFDVIDLIRKRRHKELTPQQRAASLDLTKRMYAFAPVIGYKPSSGVVIGVAGNIAFFRGDPKTTRISSTVASLTFSSLKQTSLTDKFALFGRDDRWALDSDNRAQWTSLDTFGLGTLTEPADQINMKFDYFRVYNTAYYKVYRRLLAGAGFHYSAHTSVGPGKDADAEWSESPYVAYGETHGFPLDSQTSAGASVNLRLDTRDNAINPDHGWLWSVSYRLSFRAFLGGESTWQELDLDVRTYRALDAGRRHKLAFWSGAIWSPAASHPTWTCQPSGWTSTGDRAAATRRAGSAESG